MYGHKNRLYINYGRLYMFTCFLSLLFVFCHITEEGVLDIPLCGYVPQYLLFALAVWPFQISSQNFSKLIFAWRRPTVWRLFCKKLKLNKFCISNFFKRWKSLLKFKNSTTLMYVYLRVSPFLPFAFVSVHYSYYWPSRVITAVRKTNEHKSRCFAYF